MPGTTRRTGDQASQRSAGRPPLTTRSELESIAIDLFTTHGFEETSVEDIALAAGMARRTFFRYFPSKADAVWGEFPALLHQMRRRLAEFPDTTPMAEAITSAVIEFNAVPASQRTGHRRRMTLILTVPALRADSTLRFVEWRSVVAEFVGIRLGLAPTSLVPTTVGHCALGASLAAYEQWLTTPDHDLAATIRQAFGVLATGLGTGVSHLELPQRTKPTPQ